MPRRFALLNSDLSSAIASAWRGPAVTASAIVFMTLSFGAPPPCALESTEAMPAEAILIPGSPGTMPPPWAARFSTLLTMSSPWSANPIRSCALSTLPGDAPVCAAMGWPSTKIILASLPALPLAAASSAPRSIAAFLPWISLILSRLAPALPPT